MTTHDEVQAGAGEAVELPELDLTDDDKREGRLYSHGCQYYPFTEKHTISVLKECLLCRERQLLAHVSALSEARAEVEGLRAELDAYAQALGTAQEYASNLRQAFIGGPDSSVEEYLKDARNYLAEKKVS